MRLLDGRELVGYIQERQAKQVRNLRQTWKVLPRLALITTTDDPIIATYMRLKQAYGDEILIDVAIYTVAQDELARLIEELNADETVHGIVVQLPLANPAETDAILALIDPVKDVDGLGPDAKFISATATAIDWLLAGYNVTLKDKAIAIVGEGRLVGAPLAKLWRGGGHTISTYDDTTIDLQSALRKADVIVSATGVPALITSTMVSPGKVLVDAGAASENGKIVGDVAPDIRERKDLTITPEKGGVGPLTIAALFDNVTQAARATIPAERP